MTDQSANDAFHSTSFMQGHNAAYLEQMYARYADDPGAVDESWKQFFAGLDDDAGAAQAEAAGPSWARADWPPMPQDDLTAALTGEWAAPAADPKEAKAAGAKIRAKAEEIGAAPSDDAIKRAVLDSIRALMLIRAHRIRGHLAADLDPLGMRAEKPHPELEPASYGFTEADMDRKVFIDNVLGLEVATLREIVSILKRTYCGTFALQYMHISNPEESAWLKERIEGLGKEIEFTQAGRKAILNKLVEAEGFEKFLHVKYMGTKRFGLDGGEALIPAMEQIIKRGGQLGLSDIVIGMPHRGRLSVLANVMQKPYKAIFNEFQGGSFKPEDVDGSGDVKYHLGASSDRDFDGNSVHLSLTANPSHLEAVNPVVLGKVRAKQDQLGDSARRQVVGILLHGDAAFAGQGIVAECFALSGVRGHRTGGTIHIVVNNQIGFTTAPHFSRSSPYPTDNALVVEAPIFHVNGDDPEAVVHAARVATEFRQKFGKDVVLDIFCYRRFGHNEGDEPMFTNPVMYKRIKDQETTLTLYTRRLVKDGLIPEGEIEDMKTTFQEHLAAEFEAGRDYKPNKADWLDGRWSHLDRRKDGDYVRGETAIPPETCDEIGRALTATPDGFAMHKTIGRLLDAKAKMFESGIGFDWATAEALAFGSLLTEGYKVRLAGQDSTRGTFSHRHSALVNQENEDRYYPLNHIREGQAPYEVIDSALSEYAVLGFEYGYSLAEPNALTLWEAQFGDFANGAQIMFDQFISSGRGQMAAHVGPRLPAAPRLRGAGPGAFLGAAGALPADVRQRQLDRRQLHHAGELLPHPAPAAAPRLPQAADPDDAEVAPAPQACRVDQGRVHHRLQLPPRPLGRCAARQFGHGAGGGCRDQARGRLLGQGLLRSAGGARRPRHRRRLHPAAGAVLSVPGPGPRQRARTLQARADRLVSGGAQEPGRLDLRGAQHRMGPHPHRRGPHPADLCRSRRRSLARHRSRQPAQGPTSSARRRSAAHGVNPMSIEVKVPTLGESVTEATVATWFKQPGDAVEADEMLCELETDKVTVEVPSPAAGTLGEIVAAEGETVGVDALLATISEGEGAAPAPKKGKSAPKAEQSADNAPGQAKPETDGTDEAGEAIDVMVPALGESVSEATVATWFKSAGDTVEADEMLCELETDKVSVEVPAPAAGTLTEIVAAGGRDRRRRRQARRDDHRGRGRRQAARREPRAEPRRRQGGGRGGQGQRRRQGPHATSRMRPPPRRRWPRRA